MRYLFCILALCAAPVWAAVDINIASLSQLEAAGFSSQDAQNIINARKTTTFRNSRDLLNIEGITQGDLNRARAGITINGKPVTTRSGTAPAIAGVRPAIPGNARPSEKQQGWPQEDRAKGHGEKHGKDHGKGKSHGN